MVKFTNHFLHKLEDLIAESEYILRYEKGNFKSGYCLLKDTKVAVVNKYYSLEGKISYLVDIVKEIEIDPQELSASNKKVLSELLQTELKI